MPDNESSGESEDFVKHLIPIKDPVWPLAQDYIDKIPSEHRKFKNKKIVQAQIHAWLAAHANPRKMGTAIEAGDLDAQAPLAKSFADWLRQLFPEFSGSNTDRRADGCNEVKDDTDIHTTNRT